MFMVSAKIKHSLMFSMYIEKIVKTNFLKMEEGKGGNILSIPTGHQLLVIMGR